MALDWPGRSTSRRRLLARQFNRQFMREPIGPPGLPPELAVGRGSQACLTDPIACCVNTAPHTPRTTGRWLSGRAWRSGRARPPGRLRSGTHSTLTKRCQGIRGKPGQTTVATIKSWRGSPAGPPRPLTAAEFHPLSPALASDLSDFRDFRGFVTCGPRHRTAHDIRKRRFAIGDAKCGRAGF